VTVVSFSLTVAHGRADGLNGLAWLDTVRTFAANCTVSGPKDAVRVVNRPVGAQGGAPVEEQVRVIAVGR